MSTKNRSSATLLTLKYFLSTVIFKKNLICVYVYVYYAFSSLLSIKAFKEKK